MTTVFSRIGEKRGKLWRDTVISRYNRLFKTDVSLYYSCNIPYLTDGKYISITHTDIDGGVAEYIAIGDFPIGIDAENVRRDVNIGIAKRFLSRDEAEYIGDNKDRFLEIWRKREAYGKMIRAGFYDKSVMDIDCFTEYELYDGVTLTVCCEDKETAFLYAD